MKKMSTYGKGSEDAVSPVIGVILMVAITVILAAVIAAFVFGMAGNVSKTRSVAFTAQKSGVAGGTPTISITNNGGPDASSIATTAYTANSQTGTGVNVTVNGAQVQPVAATGGVVNASVGTSAKFTGTTTKDHVIVTVSFTDGTAQVMLDTEV
ncbi:MAG: type IV pilin [Methanomicrobiales archaeon]